MKKIIAIIAVLILIVGCDLSEMNNTPIKKVEEFFNKFQALDKEVLNDLDKIVAEEERFNTKQRNEYREIMKKHYQHLRYNIKEEEVNGDKANVTVELEVTDYSKVLQDAELHLQEKPEEFQNNDGEFDPEKYMDYRLDKLKEAEDEVKYTLNLKVTKVDNKWIMDPISAMDEEKIHGIYLY